MFDKLGRAHLGAALIALTVAACGGDGGDQSTGGATAGGGGPAASPVDASTAGSVAGRIMFTGTAPAPEPIDMRDEPQCAEKHASQPTRERVKVGGDGGLANVFVYVKSGPVTQMQFPVPNEPVVLDQEGCIYHPHVLGLQVGQQLTVKNSDPLMHNVNATPSVNRGFNFSQPAPMETSRTLPQPEVMIPVRCDVHGWMESFIGVTSHPYHAVTTEDGNFTLENLPPGEYEIEAWHERFGTQTQTVTVPQSGRAEVMIHFTGQQAARPVPLGEPLYVDHATGTLRRGGAPAHSHSGHQ